MGALLVLLAALALLAAGRPADAAPKVVILSTTTSTQDSGLLDVLVPMFERQTGYTVKTVAVGTGQALALAARGEADVTLAHAPTVEKKYVAEGNATTYGLAAAVWTRDVAKALKAARAIRAGTVWVNAYNLYDAALPFGGFKESGFGREMGSAGLEHYTEVKSVWVDLS